MTELNPETMPAPRFISFDDDDADHPPARVIPQTPAPPIRVDAIVSTGFSLLADVRLQLTHDAVLVVRRMRVYRGSDNVFQMQPPSQLDQDRVRYDVVSLPKIWRAAVLAAIVEHARMQGLVP